MLVVLYKLSTVCVSHIQCRMVIENLKEISPERKCFRLVGGVLVERTVKDVLPALTNNRDQVKFLCISMGVINCRDRVWACFIHNSCQCCFILKLSRFVPTLSRFVPKFSPFVPTFDPFVPKFVHQNSLYKH